MNIVGSSRVSPALTVAPIAAAARDSAVTPVAPVELDAASGAATGAQPGVQDTGAPAPADTVDTSSAGRAASAALADAEVVFTMPATPLAHILTQLKATIKAQRVTAQVSQRLAVPPRYPTPARLPTAAAARRAAKAYVDVQRATERQSDEPSGDTHHVDTTDRKPPRDRRSTAKG